MTGGAFLYAGLFILLVSSPLHGFLTWLLSPLGKTALTNYISATLLLLLLKGFIHSSSVIAADTFHGWLTVLLLCVGILALQRVVGGLWLRYFAQGPLEWVWRKATWLGTRRTPFRKRSA